MNNDEELLEGQEIDEQEGALKQVAEHTANMAKQKIEKEVQEKGKKIASEASKKVAKAGAEVAKKAALATAKLATKIIAVLGPYIPFIIIAILIIVIAIAFFGAIEGIVDDVKKAFSGVIDNIVEFFTLDGDTYKISDEKLDEIIKNLEDGEYGINLNDLDLTRDDIKSFLEANMITQTVDGYKIGDKKGAIQVWVTNPDDTSEGLSGSKKLTYIGYEDFQQEISNKDESCLLHYTVDSSNNIIVVAQNRQIVEEDGTVVKDEITYSTKSFGYKTVTAQYEMPIMFFIDMQMITNNKAYVLALAEQVKNTQIIISMQDSRTQTYTQTTREVETSHTTPDGREVESTKTIVIETTNITHSLTPTITKADTLLYTKEMIYTNNVTTESTESSSITKNTYNPGLEKDPFIKKEEFERNAKTIYFGYGEAYSGLIDGGEMLFELMDQNVNNEILEQILKYILYQLSGYDFGVTELDSSLFEIKADSFQNITASGVDISTTTSMFTKEVFVQALQSYANKTGNADFIANFLPKAELIYDLGVQYNVNPELIVTMALKESGFKSRNRKSKFLGIRYTKWIIISIYCKF